MIFTIATCDKFYFEQLLVLLTSAKINSPNSMINAILIDYPKDITEKLKTVFTNCIFENSTIKRVDDRGIHFILMRIELIRWRLGMFKKSSSWIDTDVIIRGDLSDFLEIGPKQLKILFRGEDAPEKVRFNAGIFNIGYSDETYNMICTWRDRLIKNMVWGMGQLELYRAYQEHKDGVELLKMSEAYNDLGDSTNDDSFSKTSLMWHSKKGHFYNEKFQKEFQYYLKIAKELYNNE